MSADSINGCFLVNGLLKVGIAQLYRENVACSIIFFTIGLYSCSFLITWGNIPEVITYQISRVKQFSLKGQRLPLKFVCFPSIEILYFWLYIVFGHSWGSEDKTMKKNLLFLIAINVDEDGNFDISHLGCLGFKLWGHSAMPRSMEIYCLFQEACFFFLKKNYCLLFLGGKWRAEKKAKTRCLEFVCNWERGVWGFCAGGRHRKRKALQCGTLTSKEEARLLY